jgi:D-alanyl-D-alanine carboxypeptidase
MGQLSLALYHDFPREYGFFATREFEFHGRIVNGHDHLLDWYPGADGLKTGYIRASGFNLATSAVHDGRRLIGVVLGGPSAGTRDRTMAALLDQGFAQLGLAPEAVVRRPPPRPVAVAAAEPAGDHLSALGKAATRLAAHLSPLTNAEAAVPLRLPKTVATADRWSIQLGAFHSEAAARQTARAAAVLPAVKDKPSHIVESGKGAKARTYRARLYDLTPQEAQKACAALKKQKIECAVVPPPLRVANR